MLRSLDLNTASEKNAAHLFGIQTMSRLSANDANLPQVLSTVEMVKRGIGVVCSSHAIDENDVCCYCFCMLLCDWTHHVKYVI